MKSHLLIIDDDANTLASLARAFRLAGHEATVCDNPMRALDIIKQEKFDLIFSDVMMPGKDGLQLLEEIRAAGITTPVVMMSGQAHRIVADRRLMPGKAERTRKRCQRVGVVVDDEEVGFHWLFSFNPERSDAYNLKNFPFSSLCFGISEKYDHTCRLRHSEISGVILRFRITLLKQRNLLFLHRYFLICCSARFGSLASIDRFKIHQSADVVLLGESIETA